MSYYSEVIADSPEGYWRLNESGTTTIVDSSGNGHTGTLSKDFGSFAYTQAVSELIRDGDTALQLVNHSNEGDYIDVGNGSGLRRTSAFSLEGWVKIPGGTTQEAPIISNQYDGNVNYFLGFDSGSAVSIKPSVGFYNGSWHVAQASSSITLDVAHHIVGTWDGTILRLYLDGIEVATNTPGSSPNTNTLPYRIGKRWDTALNPQFFTGVLDEVAIYPSTLSAGRVSAHYAAGFAPNDIPGLKVWLKANAGFGGFSNSDPVSTWEDQSGNGNDFTGSGATRPLWKTNIAGSQPGILWDNTNNNHLDSADLSALFPSAGTVFIVYDPNGDNGYQLARNVGNDSWARWDGDGHGYSGLFRTTRIDGYPASMPTTAGRHTYAIKSSSSTYVAYKDGVAQSAQSAGYNAGTVWYLGEGEGNNARRFGGYMFEVLVYDSALSDGQIASLETYAEALWSFSPGGTSASPSVVAGVGAVPAPTSTGAATALPAAVAGVGSVPAPTATGTGVTSPAAVAGVGTVPAPTAVGTSAGTAAPSVVAGVGTVPAPTTTGTAVASPAVVAGVGAVPAPTATGASSGTALPAAVVGVASIPAPTAKGNGTTSPARVIGIGAVPAPTAIGGFSTTVAPATVVGIGRVPFATALGQGTGGGGGSPEGVTDFWSISLAS